MEKQQAPKPQIDIFSAYLLVLGLFVFGWSLEFAGFYSSTTHSGKYTPAGWAVLFVGLAIGAFSFYQKGRYFFYLLSDYRFCVAVGSFSALATIGGTLILQGKTYSQYVHIYGPAGARLVTNLFLTNLFWSLWYVTIFGAFLLALILVPLRRKTYRIDRLGFLAAHTGFALVIAGAFISYIFGYSGMITVYKGETKKVIQDTKTKDFRHLNFEIYLKKFAMDHYKTQVKLDCYYVRHAPFRNPKPGNPMKMDLRRIATFDLTKFPKEGVLLPQSDYRLVMGKYYPHFGWKQKLRTVADPKHKEKTYTLVAMDWKLGKEKGKLQLFPQFPVRSFHSFAGRQIRLILLPTQPPQSFEKELLKGKMPARHRFTFSAKGKRSQTMEVIPHGTYSWNGFQFKILRFLPHLVVDPKKGIRNKSQFPHNPALEVELSKGKKKEKIWIFSKLGSIHDQFLKAYKIHIQYDYRPVQYGYNRYLVGILKDRTWLEIEGGKILTSTPMTEGYEIPSLGFGISNLKISQVAIEFEAVNRSSQPENPAVELKIFQGKKKLQERTLFLHPQEWLGREVQNAIKTKDGKYILQFRLDRPVKTYTSHVAIYQAGKKAMEGEIMVNHPLWYGGHAIYQSDHIGEEGSVFNVVYDPGLIFVLCGIVLCVLGVPYMFYVQPYLRRRKKKKLQNLLASKSERS